MSMVCCLSQRPQQSWQISLTTRAPMAPGKGTRSNPARVCPQRLQVTVAGMGLLSGLIPDGIYTNCPPVCRLIGLSPCQVTASERHTETDRCPRRKTVNRRTDERAVVRPPLGSDSVHRVLVALPGIGAIVARVLD